MLFRSYLDRRVCTVTPGRIDIRPARSIIVLPLATLAIGIGCFVTVALSLGSLPLWTMIVLMLMAVGLVPVSGMGLVYSVVGAHIVIERHKQSAVLQQGYLGMGVGTQELIPFWKIDHIAVTEADLDGDGVREDFSQFEVLIVKIDRKSVV